MLAQGIEPWKSAAVHDTVAVLLQDAAYRRSFWSSLGGRLLTELGRFIVWLIEMIRGIPGGKVTVLTVIAVVILLVAARLYLAAGPGDDQLWRRKGIGTVRGTRRDPWADAEALAAAGDYMAAAHSLYQAVLKQIAATERVRLHSSKTSGDYARELRRRGSPVAGPFQAFGRRFDRVVFGAGVCTAEDFAAMRRDALAIPQHRAAA
jgi:hypothetical protein